jgi:hypothetical protein
MLSLLHVGHCLAAFYGVLGLFILRLARKPRSRICLDPGRLSEPASLGVPEFAKIARCALSKESQFPPLTCRFTV